MKFSMHCIDKQLRKKKKQKLTFKNCISNSLLTETKIEKL